MTASASAYLALSMVCVVAMTLLWSGLGHLREERLKDVLGQQGVIPARVIHRLAFLIPVVEVTAGLTLAAGLVIHSWVQLLGAALSLGLLCSYVAYQSILLRTKQRIPCGCSPTDDVPVSAWTLLRAGLLAGAAALGFMEVSITSLSGDVLVLSILTATGLGIVVWFLPNAVTGGLATRGQPHLDPEWRWR